MRIIATALIAAFALASSAQDAGGGGHGYSEDWDEARESIAADMDELMDELNILKSIIVEIKNLIEIT